MSNSISVAVSGITGFLGAHCAARLLRAGYTVHGTVRRNTPEKVAHLTSLETSGTLKVFEADLNTPDSFDAALEGCTYAMHVASPYIMNVKDPQKDLVDPAVNGTLSFLNSCKKQGVKKVVLTSSLAAIADGGSFGKTVDENDWNEHSDLKFLPYYYSKTMAEKAAWKFIEEEGDDMKLVVINPVVIWGPAMTKTINESFNLVIGTMKGQFYGMLDLDFPVVDVRDVAEAHFVAMESDVADGRYICMADRLVPHKEIIDVGLEMGFTPPTTDLTGKFATKLIKMFSYVTPGGPAGQYTRGHLGNPILPSNEKIKKDLKIEFRDAADTLKDTLQFLIEKEILEKPEA